MQHLVLGGLVALGASIGLASALRIDDEPDVTTEEEEENWDQSLKRYHFDPSYIPHGQVVPFRLIKENPVIPLLLNGDSQVTCWIVDSGYGYTAMDNSVYKNLRLKPTGTVALETLQTDKLITTMVPPGVIYDFNTLKPVVESPPHTAVVRKLKTTLETTWGNGSFCTRPGGILGISFLNHFVTRLDYVNQTLTFYNPENFEYKGNGMIFNEWLDVENYFLVPLTVDGVTVKAAIDSGAFATIMTKGFLKKYQQIKGRPFGYDGDDGSVEASFSETNITLRKKRVPKIYVGSALINNSEVLFPSCNDTVCPGLLQNGGRFDSLFGYNLLRHFIVYLIYKPVPYCVLEPI